VIRLIETATTAQQWGDHDAAFGRLANPPAALADMVADVIRDGFAANFEAERAGNGAPWATLAARTQAERRRLGFPPEHPILVRTGDYRRSFVDRNNPDHIEESTTAGDRWTLAVGSQDYRVAWHERGTGIMPARSALEMDQAHQERIAQALETMVGAILAEAASG
jgi:hypothetical protein